MFFTLSFLPRRFELLGRITPGFEEPLGQILGIEATAGVRIKNAGNPRLLYDVAHKLCICLSQKFLKIRKDVPASIMLGQEEHVAPLFNDLA